MKRMNVLSAAVFFLIAVVLADLPASGGKETGSSGNLGSSPEGKAGVQGFEWAIEGNDELLPGVDAAKVVGNIITAGSSTVFPLSERIAELFIEEGYAGNITIDSIGSGAGFERWAVSGETDIANASRAISEKEIAAAKAIGREPLEFRIGTDALAVTVSSKNTFLTGVTQDQLKKIFSVAVYWSDVDPSWPKQEILRFTPGTDSGTFDYFVEHLFKKDRKPLLSSKNLQMSEDDNILVQGVSESPYGIGFFGYAYFEENRSKMKVLSIDGVTPDRKTVDDGLYPLARPLFLYTSARILKEKPQVAAFLAYYLQNVDRVIRRVGYFQARPEAIRQAKQAWLDAVKGNY